MMINKFGKIKPLEEAIAQIDDGCRIMIAGFGGHGSCFDICEAIVEKNVRNLTLISIDAGDPDLGPDHIVANRQVRKLITSHIGATKAAGEQLNAGELEVEFCSQGTLAERIRAGGVGLGGILTDVGVGTMIEYDKPKVMVGGVEYLLEEPLRADVAVIEAEVADEYGNLVYKGTDRGLNPLMARAADITIVGVKRIVPFGFLDPECIVTPGCFVDMIVEERRDWKWPWT